MNSKTTIRKPAVVYVVDDDCCVRKWLLRLLDRARYDVRVFASADEFLARDRDGSIENACLVLDVAMPGLSGIELQEALGEDSLPIIFITGHGDIPMGVRAMKKGATDFFVKPVAGRDLLDAIEVALRKDKEVRARRAEIAEIRKREEVLTPRERDVMQLVVTGMLNKQIGGELGIEEGTVKIHRGRMMVKMGVSSVAELVGLCSKIAAE
ncbi:response regulator transcription factor [Pontiella sulfatireligans]|uniref:Response regulator protein TmoT n=1 Tax=Pontiella sulfatireligans TaxID=2750658 RepID=A0A6C2UJ43_9BACT|nr:response regulator [Pontiella sulfatireligans]VGO19979.1 Response regulator protein TmoT [Pontiella sulfatireligans]